jgi:DnaJ-class molecular chaperone
MPSGPSERCPTCKGKGTIAADLRDSGPGVLREPCPTCTCREERDRYRAALQEILDMDCPFGAAGDALARAQVAAAAAIGDGNVLVRGAQR